MAARFWVGGTGTWDASDQTHWSTTTGPGDAPQSVPVAGDSVTFDGASGGGTVTVNTDFSITNLTFSAFTGTLTLATNNNSPTISGAFTNTGSGTRTLSLGNGTWTLTATSGTPWNFAGNTNLTLNANSSTILYSAVPTALRAFAGGTKTYNNFTVTNAAAGAHTVIINQANTFANITYTNQLRMMFQGGNTTTISGTFTFGGSAANQAIISTDSGGVATLALANATVASWVAASGLTRTGAGSLTLNNSFDCGGNTSVTFTPPGQSAFAHRRAIGIN